MESMAKVESRVPDIAMVAALVLTTCTSVLCVGCENRERNKTLALAALNELHQRLASEQYHEAYEAADPELRQTITEEIFTAQLRTVHERLGTAQSSTVRDYMSLHRGPREILLNLTYDTRFSRGTAVEHVISRQSNGHSSIVSYEVRSSRF